MGRVLKLSSGDTTGPTIIITSPTAGTIYAYPTTNVTVIGTAADAESGIALVEIRLNGGAWQVATGTVSWTGVLAGMNIGPNTIDARATNGVGLTALASVSVIRKAAPGTVTYFSSAYFLSPWGYTSLSLDLYAGGGGGGANLDPAAIECNGGGGGGYRWAGAVGVTQNTYYYVTVGAAGAGAIQGVNPNGGTGGSTVFGGLASISGGVGGHSDSSPAWGLYGGNGSCGGGGGCWRAGVYVYAWGGTGTVSNGGTGKGGVSPGCGGGGGGRNASGASGAAGGAGGAGGGGRGGYNSTNYGGCGGGGSAPYPSAYGGVGAGVTSGTSSAGYLGGGGGGGGRGGTNFQPPNTVWNGGNGGSGVAIMTWS